MAIEALLAVWGAVLSTRLAALKIWEIYRDRPRLSTSYGLSAEGYGGNEIILENPSKLPVMISYWELLLLRRRGLGYETINGRFPNEGYCNITVGAHSRHTLHFKDQDYFPWGRAALGGGAWYLKLHIIGKARPIWFKIWPRRDAGIGWLRTWLRATRRNRDSMSRHPPFTELTEKFSPKRKQRIAKRVAEIKAEKALAESDRDPSPLGEKVPRRGG